jgi:hypothetical protein
MPTQNSADTPNIKLHCHYMNWIGWYLVISVQNAPLCGTLLSRSHILPLILVPSSIIWIAHTSFYDSLWKYFDRTISSSFYYAWFLNPLLEIAQLYTQNKIKWNGLHITYTLLHYISSRVNFTVYRSRAIFWLWHKAVLSLSLLHTSPRSDQLKAFHVVLW